MAVRLAIWNVPCDSPAENRTRTRVAKRVSVVATMTNRIRSCSPCVSAVVHGGWSMWGRVSGVVHRDRCEAEG